MSVDSAPPGELLELVVTYTSGAASDGQFDHLEELLDKSEEARFYYVKALDLHAGLYWHRRQHVADMEVLRGVASRNEAEFPSCEASLAAFLTPSSESAASRVDRSAPSARPAFPVPGFSFLSTTLPGTVGYFSSGWPVAYLAATVIFAIGALVGSLVHVSQPGQLAEQSVSLPSPLSSSPSVVGRITGMVECQWQRKGLGIRDWGFEEGSKSKVQGSERVQSPIPNPQSLVSLGDKFILSSGLMEITYDTGARVILQGPVTYVVESKNGGFLSLGKLAARVEKKVVSGQWSVASKSEISNPQSPIPNPLFAVRTPTATVIDLGTEFGVEVSSEGVTDTQVFVGKVQIATAGGRYGGNGQSRVIQAGQYAHVGKDLMLVADERDFEVRAKRFTRILLTGSPTSEAYAELVLSMNPVVYYRMDKWPKTDKKGCYTLVDSAPGGRDGVAHFDETFGTPLCRGKFGGALDFHGPLGSDYAFVEDYPKSDNGQLSVSAWVWAVTLDPWASIAVNWFAPPLDGPTIGQFALGVNQNFELTAEIRQRDGKPLKVIELDNPLSRSQWQHVAFVADGTVLRLYRNGTEVRTVPYHGLACPSCPECLSVGCEMSLDGTKPRPPGTYVWNGRLDEIAVFNHALSAEQVRQLSAERPRAASGRASP